MKIMSNSLLTKATLALALAAGGTALHAQETDAPPPPAPEEPAPTEPAPEPTPSEPVDENGDGVDDVTGEPIPQDSDTSSELR
jgi:hypothetical protein